MLKIYKIFLILILFLSPASTNAHVQHYDDLKRIEFDIYRNNKLIGTHVFSFTKVGEELKVKSLIKFQIKKLGVVLYKYQAEGTEIYQNGELVGFNSTTDQNGKSKYVNMKKENNEYSIDGSSYQGKAPVDFLIGTWWNHSLVKANAQISAVSGRIIKQKVEFIGKEKINFGSKTYNSLHFNFSSTDMKLKKNKRLNTDVWYDEETLYWVKASFDKQGKWEYRLTKVEKY